jgi:hypothetical protein
MFSYVPSTVPPLLTPEAAIITKLLVPETVYRLLSDTFLSDDRSINQFPLLDGTVATG